MKNFELLFLAIIIASCQIDEKKAEDGESKENNSIIIKSYYEKSGALKSEITVINNKKNGPAKKYYPTGEIHTIVYYVNNIKEDSTIWFYKNGIPYRITPYKNGIIDGLRKIYYDNGNIQAEIPYEKGELVEGTKEYNTNGILITNYPKIIFETRNDLLVDNKFIVYCKMSNNSRNITFYQEVINDYNQKRFTELKSMNGIAQIEFYIPSMTKVDKEIIIYAHAKSSMGNPYITKNIYKLILDTN